MKREDVDKDKFKKDIENMDKVILLKIGWLGEERIIFIFWGFYHFYLNIFWIETFKDGKFLKFFFQVQTIIMLF